VRDLADPKLDQHSAIVKRLANDLALLTSAMLRKPSSVAVAAVRHGSIEPLAPERAFPHPSDPDRLHSSDPVSLLIGLVRSCRVPSADRGGNALASGSSCRRTSRVRNTSCCCRPVNNAITSGPWRTCSVTGPDRGVAQRPWRPNSRQSGMSAMPPCRRAGASQAVAATGAGCSPGPDSRESANAEPLAQPELAMAAARAQSGLRSGLAVER
jgi:hypothetical protein